MAAVARSRTYLRISNLGRRSASSTTEKAQESAKSAANTAQQYAANASATASKYASQAGNLTSGLLGSYREPVVHNLSVAREIAKQVYIKEQLAPPTSIGQITQAYEQIYNSARDAKWWRSIVENGQYLKIGVYALEAYGIFKIGEMVGRRHIVGYSLTGPKPAAHH